MIKANTYNAIKTDLKKLEARIAIRQKWCDEEAADGFRDAAEMFEKDVKDLTDILNYLTKGDYKTAWNLIIWLDTAVRDDIPARLYNFLAKENGYN
jgi:hypothetical protein